MKHVRKVVFNEFGSVRPVWEAIGMIALVVLLVIVLFIAPIAGFTALAGSNKCDTLESYDSVHEYRWDLWSGCRVKTNRGYWVDVDNPALIELEQGE